MPLRLFRPVGLHELALILDTGLRAFPPRLPHQPFFYPVTNESYAAQIANRWNTQDEASGFAGYVTRIELPASFMSRYEKRVVGAREHEEYWIPAEDLPAFNAALLTPIEVISAAFGAAFSGWPGETDELAGAGSARQREILLHHAAHPTRFVALVAPNRRAMFLNCLHWACTPGPATTQLCTSLRAAWTQAGVPFPLPAALP